MRSNIVVCLALAAFFSGCAHEGVMIGKRVRPVPSFEPLGVNAIYTLELRDRAGQIHLQMVTADIFARYEIGDYFDDLHPYAPPASGPDFKEIQQPAAPAENEGPFRPQVYLPVKTTSIHYRRNEAARVVKLQHGQKQRIKIAKTNPRATRYRKTAQHGKVQPRVAQI